MERDLWNRWVAAKDSSDLLATERTRVGAEGEWIIDFLYVDHTAGLSMRVDSWARRTWLGKLRQTAGVPRDQALIVRHGLVEKLEVTALSSKECERFSLPLAPEWLGAYSDKELESLRSDHALDPLRAPAFPDDLKAAIVDTPTGSVEFIWARAERRRSTGGIEAVLLNKPQGRYGLGAGDHILIEVVRYGLVTTAICAGKVD